MPKSDRLADGYLSLIFHNQVDTAEILDEVGDNPTTAIAPSSPAGSVYISLHTAYPGLTGTQTTSEATWAGATPYARVAVARSSGGWTIAAYPATSVSNAGAITFPQKQDAGTVSVKHVVVGTRSGLTAGSILYICPLALAESNVFLVDTSGVTNNDVICAGSAGAGHGFVAGDEIVFFDVDGGTLPTGSPAITEGTVYFVIATGLTTFTFRFSDTLGGSAVDITDEGSGRVAKVLTKTIGQNDTFSIDVGKLVIKER